MKMPDGSWRFWIRVIKIGDRKTPILITIQLATDRSFSQVVDTIDVKLDASHSFIAMPRYKPTLHSSTLYYRYILVQSSSNSLSQQIVGPVASISPWSNISQPEQ